MLTHRPVKAEIVVPSCIQAPAIHWPVPRSRVSRRASATKAGARPAVRARAMELDLTASLFIAGDACHTCAPS